MNLTDLARTHPEKPAVLMADGSARMTYAELEASSNRIAHLFRSHGLQPGDHVAMLLRNQIEVFPVAWAAHRAGLLYTPVNWHLSEDEAAYIVDNCGARVLIVDADLVKLAEAIAPHTPRVAARYVVGRVVEKPGFEPLAEAVADLPVTPVAEELEGYAMVYSSGTTGRPKGVLPQLYGAKFGAGLPIDHRMRDRFGFGPETVFLSPAPLYHAMALAWSFGTIRNGGTVVTMSVFDAEAALRAVETYRVTHAQFVPTMFVRMLKLPPELREQVDISSVRSILHSAAPCPVEVKRRMIDWFGPKLMEFYGGTEANGFFMIDSEEWMRHEGSVGRPVKGEPHIVGPGGEELPPGEVGEIWISGVADFAYHDDPEKTAGAFNERGWSTLGDLGHLDEDGYLYLSARRVDLILSGGVNIYPQEIEDALVLHPKVVDVAVIGIPDPEMGQSVHAVVNLAASIEESDDLVQELIDFAREKIAGYKVPRSMSFEPIPRLPSGKILRRELMQRFENGPTPATA